MKNPQSLGKLSGGMSRRAILPFVVGLSFLAACGITEATPTPTRLPLPTAAELNDWFLSLLDNANADSSELPTEQLTATEFDLLLASLEDWSAPSGVVAEELNTLDPTWELTPSDVDAYVEGVCNVGAQSAARDLLLLMPGARLDALPSLNRATALVASRCVITNPQALDVASNTVVQQLIANESSATTPLSPPPVSEQSADALDIYDYSCAAGGLALERWMSSRIHTGRYGGWLMAIGLAGASLYCPQTISGIIE